MATVIQLDGTQGDQAVLVGDDEVDVFGGDAIECDELRLAGAAFLHAEQVRDTDFGAKGVAALEGGLQGAVEAQLGRAHQCPEANIRSGAESEDQAEQARRDQGQNADPEDRKRQIRHCLLPQGARSHRPQ